MRDITSEPPKRCGFSNDASATSSPVSRSNSRSTTVVVPRSIAMPWSGPLHARSPRHRSGCDRHRASPPGPTPRRALRQSIRVPLDAHVGRAASCGSAPGPLVQRCAWHDSRKLPAQVLLLLGRARESTSMPSATSTMHSLHLPCLLARSRHGDAERARRSRRAKAPAMASSRLSVDRERRHR